MSTKPMQPMQDDNSGEEQGSYQQCEQEIEDLEARVAAIEQKLGIASPADEQEPDELMQAIQGNANPFKQAKSL